MTPPGNCAIEWNCSGGYGIHPYDEPWILRLRKTVRGVGAPPPTRENLNCDTGKALRRGQDPSIQYRFIKECRGAQCAPVQFNGNASLRGQTMFAPTANARLDVGGAASLTPCRIERHCNINSLLIIYSKAPTGLFTNLFQFTPLTFTIAVLQY